MQEIRIDDEFKTLLLPLSAEEYAELEQSIISEGCRDALITWHGILIDGHNRYEICQKHNIEFNVVDKEFDNRDEVIDWMYHNQLGRRNLNDKQRDIIIGRIYKQEKKQGTRTDLTSGHCDQKSTTAETIANNYNVSEKTARRAEQFVDAVDNISQNIEKSIVDKILNDEIPVTKKDILKIAAYDPDRQKDIVEKIVSGEAKSLVDAHRLIKKEEVHEVPEIDGKYRIIYADCPWSYGDKLTEGYGTAENHYPTMSIEELCNLPVKDLAEDNAVLFFWITSPLLEECFAVIKAWGFKYKASFVWDKVKHNMGHYNSVRHELLLICTRGSCLPDNNQLFDSVVSIERSDKHSQKPEEFRKIIDELYPVGKRIELFAREKTDGWNVWGNQV